MAKHKWGYKTTQGGFLVICADCGAIDPDKRVYYVEEQVQKRVLELTMVQKERNKRFSGGNRYEPYGLNRRIRKGKKVRLLLEKAEESARKLRQEVTGLDTDDILEKAGIEQVT